MLVLGWSESYQTEAYKTLDAGDLAGISAFLDRRERTTLEGCERIGCIRRWEDADAIDELNEGEWLFELDKEVTEVSCGSDLRRSSKLQLVAKELMPSEFGPRSPAEPHSHCPRGLNPVIKCDD